MRNNAIRDCGPEADVKLRRGARTGDLEMMQQALESGAQIDAVNTIGWNALHYAIIDRNYDSIKFLLSRGAAPDAPILEEDIRGQTALGLAVLNGHVNLVELLVEYGANPTAQTQPGLTAMELMKLPGFRMHVRDSEVIAQIESILAAHSQKT